MATTSGLTDRIDGSLSIKDETIDLCNMSRIGDLVEEPLQHSKNRDDLLPILADDLMNLCDSYNLYLINEEIVYTEPFDYDSSVNVDSPILEEDLFSDEIGATDGDRDFEENEGQNENVSLSSNVVPNIDYFSCVCCHQYFSEKQLLIEHHKSHEIWSCYICDAHFNSQNKLKKHTVKQHKQDVTPRQTWKNSNNDLTKPYTCQYCPVQFARSSALISHERIHTAADNKIQCSTCSISFTNVDNLNIHTQECTITADGAKQLVKKPRKKKRNAIRVNQISTLSPNAKATNTVKKPILYKIPCPECNKMFQTRQKMQRHKWIHRKKPFSCEVCAMSFLLQSELDGHRLSEHAEQKKYSCTECGKSFASRQGLWEHNRSHDESKTVPYVCRECTKTFSSRSGMLIHLRTHSGEKPFMCKFCDKTFRDGGTLRKHLRIHTGERPHKCPLCEKNFNQKVVMREHIRWVHASNKLEYSDPAPYSCLLCSNHAPLMDREELCMHIVKHSDQIASITKTNAKQNITIKEETDTVQAEPHHQSDTINAQTDGVKCDQSIIRRNRELLRYIQQANDDRDADVKAISIELKNNVCLTTTDERNVH